MGAINYGRSKYITLGYNTDVLYEEKEELEDNDIYYDVDDTIYSQFEELEYIVGKYNFDYFDVKLKSGYYDGFYLEIKDNEYVYFDDMKEREDVLKEISVLKKLLLELIDNGLLVCYPWWVTKWLNDVESIKEVNKAIATIRKDIRKIPTYRTYKRMKGA